MKHTSSAEPSPRMRHPKVLPQGFRLNLRLLLIYLVGGFMILWFASSVFFYFYDYCEGRAYTRVLCSLYEQGVVDGKLCPALCRRGTFYVHSCSKGHSQYRVFYFNNTVVKVKEHHFGKKSINDYDLQLAYQVPEKGSSMEDFRNMVLNFLEEKLGKNQGHANLLTAILDYADSNDDGKVSLAEAKSMWALLQHNEFFVLFLFRQSEYVPKIHGSCGDLYAVERVPVTSLYIKDSQSLLSYFFPQSYTWGFPSWHNRVKIVVGLLEFALDAYQHGSEGSFFMCNIHPSKIGYTNQFDVKFYDVNEMLSKQELEAYFLNTPCTFDKDCSFSKTCVSACNSQAKKCNRVAFHPNLYYICSMLQHFLKPDLPRAIKGDLGNLWDKCQGLAANVSDVELQHSLVLNDLKSLLWKQISDHPSH